MHYPAKWSGGFQSRRFFPRFISFFPNLTSAAFQCPALAKMVTKAPFYTPGIPAAEAAVELYTLRLAQPALPRLEQQPGHGAQLRPQAWHRASPALKIHSLSQVQRAQGGTCGFLGAAWLCCSSSDSCRGKSRQPLLPILIQPQISRKCSTTSILRRIHISSVSKIEVLWFSLTNFFFFLMVWNHRMFLIFIFRGIIVKVYQRLSGHSWQDT